MIAFRKGDSLKTYSNFGHPLSSFEGLYCVALSLSSSWFPPSNNRPPCWMRGYIPLLSTDLPTGFKNCRACWRWKFSTRYCRTWISNLLCSPFPPCRPWAFSEAARCVEHWCFVPWIFVDFAGRQGGMEDVVFREDFKRTTKKGAFLVVNVI